MRTFEDYKREVLEDGKDRIDEGVFDDWDDCYEDMFLSVTGNDNGSYFFNSAKAALACAGLEFDQDFLEALEWHFGCEDMLHCLKDGPEAFDVLVRIVALYEVGNELEEYFQEKEEDGS